MSEVRKRRWSEAAEGFCHFMPREMGEVATNIPSLPSFRKQQNIGNRPNMINSWAGLSFTNSEKNKVDSICTDESFGASSSVFSLFFGESDESSSLFSNNVPIVPDTARNKNSSLGLSSEHVKSQNSLDTTEGKFNGGALMKVVEYSQVTDNSKLTIDSCSQISQEILLSQSSLSDTKPNSCIPINSQSSLSSCEASCTANSGTSEVARKSELADMVFKRVSKATSEQQLFSHIISSQDSSDATLNGFMNEPLVFFPAGFTYSGPTLLLLCSCAMKSDENVLLIFKKQAIDEARVTKLEKIIVFDCFLRLYLSEKTVLFPFLFKLFLSVSDDVVLNQLGSDVESLFKL